MDAETAARTILRDLLSGVPDVYLILDGEQQLAHVERTRRPTAPPPEAGGLLGRLRRTVAEALPIQDWTLLVDAPLTPDETRVLIAATLLLLDHTIAGHQSV
jgi:hypothetical protein